MPEIDYEEVYGRKSFPLAPVGHRFPRIAKSKEELASFERENDIEDYQRKKLSGYTTQEIIDLDAHSPRQLKPSTLKNPLHNLFRKPRWQTQESVAALAQNYPGLSKNLYPINSNNPLPYTGNWEANNPPVWKLLEPALRLTTKMLTSSQVLPWLETLLLAGIDDTDKMLWPDGYNYSFLEQPRVLNHLKNVDPALAAEKGAKERGRFLLELQNNYGFTLGFQDRGRDGREGNENNTDPQSGNHGITRAIAGATQSLEKVLLYLQTNDIEGLFRHNPMIVPDYDIFGAQWFLAVTLLHEMMHALWFARDAEIRDELIKTDCKKYEGIHLKPTIEGEAFLEHGFSMESSVFGGVIKGLLKGERGGRLARVYCSYPTISDSHFSDPKYTLRVPLLSTTREEFFATVHLNEQLQQEEFWEVAVRNYGLRQIIQLSTPRKWSVKLKLLEDRSGQKYISKFDVREENNWSRGEFVDQFNKMYETMDIAAMTPEEREHVEWAIEFILSTESMGDFWNFEQETSFYVDKIMALLKKPRGGSNSLAAKKYQLIIKPLVEAISAHEEAVTSILTTDRLNGTVEIAPLLLPQRQILLQWNQGTRIFIYHLKNKLDSSDTAELKMLEKVGLDLDSCRMLLAKPTEDYNRGLGEQYKNMNLVKKSFDDAVSGDRLRSFQVATDCNKIMLEDATACPFDKLCARILSCTISFAPPSGLAEMMGEVCDQLDILGGADREGAIYDKEWTDIITK